MLAEESGSVEDANEERAPSRSASDATQDERRPRLRRRDLLRGGSAGALVAALGGCAPSPDGEAPAVITRPRLNWRLASSFPRSLDTIFGAAEVLSERIAILSDDRFRIRPYQSLSGQGTLGLELHEQNPELDAVIVPVGGGGLIAGIALALKRLKPKIRVIGVQAEASGWA